MPTIPKNIPDGSSVGDVLFSVRPAVLGQMISEEASVLFDNRLWSVSQRRFR